jgi:hypothetical protein
VIREFPIYDIDFTIYSGTEEVAGCEHNMMLMQEFDDHAAAYESLWCLVQNLAEHLTIEDIITGWTGSVVLVGSATWCLHYKSHYTYQLFANPVLALAAFIDYAQEHPDEVETDLADWRVCGCNICKALNRTMILHSGDEQCTCSSVS